MKMQIREVGSPDSSSHREADSVHGSCRANSCCAAACAIGAVCMAGAIVTLVVGRSEVISAQGGGELRGVLAAAAIASEYACDVRYTFDVRDWVVDYLRPTADLGGKASRKSPYDIATQNKKAALLINNSYPGPLVEAYEDEWVCITVHNNLLSEALSIHWHGVKMRGTPFMDGVYGVTQAGIPAQGGVFTYRFRANAGTHFYHAHMQAMQADRGLKGPILIHKRSDPHAKLYNEERIVALSDEWPNAEVCLRAEGAQPGNPVCAEIDRASWNGVWGDGSEEYPWPLVVVEKGKCYRLRFIGMMGQAQNFLIDVAGHNMTLIAVDGVDVEPVNLTRFNLHAGERADVVICADQQPGNYLMSAVYDLACFLEHAPSPKMPIVDSCKFWAFLHYQGEPAPTSRASRSLLGGYRPPAGTGGGESPKKGTGIVWNTNEQSSWRAVRNLDPVPELDQADVTYVIDVGVVGPQYEVGISPYASSDRMYMFTNRTPWKKPLSPLLHTKGKCGAEGVPFIDVPENATTVELIINNLSPTAHVLHMHGMTFSVINFAPYSESWCSTDQFECFFTPLSVAKELECPGARAGDPGTKFPFDAYWGCPYDAERDNKTRNLEAPLQKDMITVWRRSWAVIRFKADNPGTWLFHCHMEQHLPTGQVMAFNIQPQQHPPIPPDVPTEGPCPVVSGP